MRKNDNELIKSLIRTLKFEFKDLSAKKPNDTVNKFKLKYVNQAIDAANDILKDDKPYSDFEQFSEDDLPTNSDVSMILSVYLNAL